MLDVWHEYSDAANALPHRMLEPGPRYMAAREQAVAAVHSRSDWENYRRRIRETLTSTLGPLPDRTPFNPCVTGVLREDGYRVEKVVYDSQPGVPVTAALLSRTDSPARRRRSCIAAGITYSGFARRYTSTWC